MDSRHLLPFEKPIGDLQAKLDDMRTASAESSDIDVSKEIGRMQKKIEETRRKIYMNLSAWQRVQVARHHQRPHTLDYIEHMCDDFVELHGDRAYRDDKAVIGGFATLAGQKIMLIGTQKGRDTKSNLERNFGCPHPEGYRKALRLMKLANRFNLPIVTLIDTKGAYAGIESEERHVAEAIAVNLRESFTFTVPMVAVITGEGGSGGALGIGIANRVLVMENAYFSVITPEGCAAILWKDREFTEQAAEALRLTATDLLELGVTDGVVPEPFGGAHTDPGETAENLKTSILECLNFLSKYSADELIEDRYKKYRAMGRFEEELADGHGPGKNGDTPDEDTKEGEDSDSSGNNGDGSTPKPE